MSDNSAIIPTTVWTCFRPQKASTSGFASAAKALANRLSSIPTDLWAKCHNNCSLCKNERHSREYGKVATDLFTLLTITTRHFRNSEVKISSKPSLIPYPMWCLITAIAHFLPHTHSFRNLLQNLRITDFVSHSSLPKWLRHYMWILLKPSEYVQL